MQHRSTLTFAAALLIAALHAASVAATPAAPLADSPDGRLREIFYDPQVVVTVPVKRGVVTDIVLEPDEAITDVASGFGADCAKPESSWCVAAQPGGRHLFVKPKTSASAPNNIAVVTDRRTHSFRFVVLSDREAGQPLYRLSIRTAPPPPLPTVRQALLPAPASPPPIPAGELIKQRLAAAPQPMNSSYSVAQAKGSEDIVPTLVFDDGRFTYLRFPNNREVPAVFQVLPDGAETVVNTRMEGDLLVADRVCRRLMLRAGSAAVGLFNDAFDPDGAPPDNGTTVSGVDRQLKASEHGQIRREGQP